MCFVWISEQTAIISQYDINWLVFITETECVYCAVRTLHTHSSIYHPRSILFFSHYVLYRNLHNSESKMARWPACSLIFLFPLHYSWKARKTRHLRSWRHPHTWSCATGSVPEVPHWELPSYLATHQDKHTDMCRCNDKQLEQSAAQQLPTTWHLATSTTCLRCAVCR